MSDSGAPFFFFERALSFRFKDLQLVDRREQLDSDIRDLQCIPGEKN